MSLMVLNDRLIKLMVEYITDPIGKGGNLQLFKDYFKEDEMVVYPFNVFREKIPKNKVKHVDTFVVKDIHCRPYALKKFNYNPRYYNFKSMEVFFYRNPKFIKCNFIK